MKFLIMYLGFNMIFLIKSIVLYSKYKKEVVERNKNELFKSFISILLFGSIFKHLKFCFTFNGFFFFYQ